MVSSLPVDTFAPVLEQYGDRARRLASSFARRIWSADRDEVWQRTLLALWEARQRYDAGKGEDFWAYASRLVRGRILDYLRELDPLSRRDRRLVREEGDDALAPWRLRQRSDDDVGDRDLATAGEGPDEEVASTESGYRFESLLVLIDPRQAEVVRRVVAGDEGYQTIARDLGVSECRVSQLYRDALATLRRLVCPCGEPRPGDACPACGSRRPPEMSPGRAPGRSRRAQLTCRGRTLTIGEWSGRVGVPVQTILRRLRRGEGPEEALSAPRRMTRAA